MPAEGDDPRRWRALYALVLGALVVEVALLAAWAAVYK
jgi:hypothetical protein